MGAGRERLADRPDLPAVPAGHGRGGQHRLRGSRKHQPVLSAVRDAVVRPVRDGTGLVVDYLVEGDYPAYGNNDDRADTIAVNPVEKIMTKLRGQPTYRGAIPTLSVLTITSNVVYGRHTGNTPDGPRAGAPFAPGANPMNGRGQHGMVAAAPGASATAPRPPRRRRCPTWVTTGASSASPVAASPPAAANRYERSCQRPGRQTQPKSGRDARNRHGLSAKGQTRFMTRSAQGHIEDGGGADSHRGPERQPHPTPLSPFRRLAKTTTAATRVPTVSDVLADASRRCLRQPPIGVPWTASIPRLRAHQAPF
jgi:hypothetical protein